MNKWRAAAAAWGLLLLAACASLGWHAARGLKLETGLMALLPQDAQKPLVNEAVARMADAGSKRIVFLAGHADLKTAGLAADAAAALLKNAPGLIHVVAKIEGDFASGARDFYFPWRYRLLRPAQRQRLAKASDAEILDTAVSGLYSPLGPPRLAPLESDPLGLFSEGLLEAASQSPYRIQDGRLTVQDKDLTWVVVLAEMAGDAMGLAEQKSLLLAFDKADAAAKQAGATETLRAGFIFHSAAAAKQAQFEMGLIGLGSTAGILLLMFWAFRSLKPLALALLPILAGCAGALGFSLLVFGQLHVLTLVFGTSIIGVAVDYGVLFSAGCAAALPWDAAARRAAILRPAGMAVGTSLLAYASLAFLPFPILRQMGVFTLLGLASAWLTAILWLPLLAATMPDASKSPAQKTLALAQRHWPRLGESRRLAAGLALGAALALLGMGRLRSNDDVRQLYASAPAVQAQQEKVQSLLRLPAAGQFYLLSAPDEEGLLQREEALGVRLAHAGLRYQALSQFVPSLKSQKADARLQWQRVYKPGALAAKLFKRLDSPETASLARKQASAAVEPLRPEAFLKTPLALPFKALWMGEAKGEWHSVVALCSAPPPDAAAFCIGIEGAQYVDHFDALSQLMGGFRKRITWILVLGYLVVALFLALAYGREAWRILAPALFGSAFVAGFFGWLGLNYNLFCVFGILLSLDMGVDYGIFMQDRRSGDFKVAFLSTSLAALSTLLSFGLLSLSRTPALRVFGLSVLLGIGATWLLAPCFSKGESRE